MTTALPVVSLADWTQGTPAQHHEFVWQVGQALEKVGFFVLVDHGLTPDLLAAAYEQVVGLFALPLAQKQRYAKPEWHGQRGYVSLGQEHAQGHPLPDWKEFWHIGRTNNLWPQELPDVAPILTRLYAALDQCAEQLLQAISLYLDQPLDFLPNLVRGGDTLLRLAHYPPLPAGLPPGILRAAPHTDINLITILCGATSEGLELQQRDGTWWPVPVLPEALVVDSGDMLQWLTNGLLRSTTHRVMNPTGQNVSRYSLPFFVHPRPEVELTPLPACVARTGGDARFGRITAGEYLHQRLQEIGVAAPAT